MADETHYTKLACPGPLSEYDEGDVLEVAVDKIRALGGGSDADRAVLLILQRDGRAIDLVLSSHEASRLSSALCALAGAAGRGGSGEGSGAVRVIDLDYPNPGEECIVLTFAAGRVLIAATGEADALAALVTTDDARAIGDAIALARGE